MSITDEIKRKSSIDLKYDSIKKQAKEIIDAEIPERVYRTNLFPTRTVIALSGVALALFLLLGIGLINKNRPAKDSEIALLNSKIDSLANTSTSEEKMLSLVALAKEVQALSQEQVLKVHAETLSAEIKQTSTDLKNSVEWSDCLDMETDYVLLESLINVDEVQEVYIQYADKNDISANDMWVCKNKDFLSELLNILDVPYSNTIRKPNEAFYSSKGMHCFLLYGENGDIKEIAVDSNGYVKICGYFGTFLSLVKIAPEALNTFTSVESLENYSALLSPVSFWQYHYSIAMSSTSGPTMTFHLSGAIAECSVTYGFIGIREEKRKATEQKRCVDSDKLIEWDPPLFDASGRCEPTLKENEKAYMDVFFRVDNMLVGYAVIEMQYEDYMIFKIKLSGFEISRDEYGNYREMSAEYAQEQINKLKEQTT